MIGFGASKKEDIRAALTAVFLHEYGHAVFKKNILLRMPKEAAGYPWGNGTRKYAQVLFRVIRDVISGFVPPAVDQMFRANREAMAAIAPFEIFEERQTSPIVEPLDWVENAAAIPGERPLGLITADYDELFADTVAVLQLNDGKAISRAMTVLGYRDYPARDSTIDHRHEKFLDRDPHRSLAPTRSFVWETHQRYPDLAPGIIIGALFDAIHDQVTTRQNRGEVALSPHEMNTRLIGVLQRRLEPKIRELDHVGIRK